MRANKWVSKVDAAGHGRLSARRLRQLAQEGGKLSPDPQGKGRVLLAEVLALKPSNCGRKLGQSARMSIPWAETLRINHEGQLHVGCIPIYVAGNKGQDFHLCGTPQAGRFDFPNNGDSERAARVLAIRLLAHLLDLLRQPDLDTSSIAYKFMHWRDGWFFEKPEMPAWSHVSDKQLDELLPGKSARRILVIAALFLEDALVHKKPQVPLYGSSKKNRVSADFTDWLHGPKNECPPRGLTEAERKEWLRYLFTDKTRMRTLQDVFAGGTNQPLSEQEAKCCQSKLRLLTENAQERKVRIAGQIAYARKSAAENLPDKHGRTRAILLLKGARELGATKESQTNIGGESAAHGFSLAVLLGESRPRASQLRKNFGKDYTKLRPRLHRIAGIQDVTRAITDADVEKLLLAAEGDFDPGYVRLLPVGQIERVLRRLKSQGRLADYAKAVARYDAVTQETALQDEKDGSIDPDETDPS